MGDAKGEELRKAVREQYGAVAEGARCGCAPSCCGPATDAAASRSRAVGYLSAETASAPEGANLGLGCGNLQAIADLKPGETALDLGNGAGFDGFRAARQVGDAGRVIGVDMTSEMVAKARANADRGGYANVEFRLGEIEHLPVADACEDVVISNCVINLSADKPRVFAEAFRVLKLGGRLAISDVVAVAEPPEALRRDIALYTGCIAGAALAADVEGMLRGAGFVDVRVRPREGDREVIAGWAPGTNAADYVVSADIEAVKPGPERAPGICGARSAPPAGCREGDRRALRASVRAVTPRRGRRRTRG
jgi:SAM-dependent methyltransferase